MTPSEAIMWLREQTKELQWRRPGCPDKTCLVCKRFAAEDLSTAEALRTLEHLAEN
jgi:hypothetical protein